jgi:hypothetical protein
MGNRLFVLAILNRILPVKKQAAWTLGAAVMVNTVFRLGEFNGGHQPITLEPDRLESFAIRAKYHHFFCF